MKKNLNRPLAPRKSGLDVFTTWKNEFKADRHWRASLVFSVQPSREKAKAIRSEIKRKKHFEDRLVKLCSEFGFDIFAKKNEDAVEFAFGEKSLGQLSYDVAQNITKALNASEREREALADLLKTPLKKTDGISVAIAYHLLVAFELVSRTDQGKRKLKKFIEPNGEFEQWLNEEGLPSQMIVYSGSNDGLSEWASSKKQTYERAIVGQRIGLEKPTMRDHAAEFEKLREKVKASARAVEQSAIKA